MTQRLISILLAAVFGLGLTACYRIPVEQGNNFKRMNFSAVHAGMTRSEVLGLLGEPVLENIYIDHQLVYVYSIDKRSSPFHVKRFLVYFQNGRVTHTQG
jgi:outer membrane protein assembly factor BamE